MRSGYYQRLVVLIFASLYLSLTTSQAIAAAVPVYNGRMNAAVGAVIQNKVGKWGFAANDPRIGATTTGVASGLTTIAVGVAGGAVASVGWPALLVAAGVAAVVGGAVSLAQDAITKWLFNSDGTVTTTSVSPGSVLAPGTSYAANYSNNPRYNSITDALLSGSNMSVILSGGCCTNGAWKFGYGALPGVQTLQIVNKTTQALMYDYSKYVSIISDAGPNVALVNADPPIQTSNTDSPQTLAARLSSSDVAKPISDELLAAAVNAAWKAADRSLGGLPWSASDPVTPADVATWRAANPSMIPTVGDAIAPVSNETKVNVSPAPATAPSVAPTLGSGTKVDLGPDPNIGAPIFEPTPTASQILSPVLNLMPDLKSFAVPVHSAGCPTPSFVALGRTYTFDSQCALIESNRSLIEAAMLLCWTLASVFIVLKA